ncbi:MAG: TolC family protein [Sandaracinaceae bacterium]
MRLALVALGALALPPGSARAQVTFDQALALAADAPEVRAAERASAAREEGDRDIGGTAQPLQIQLQPGGRVVPEQDQGWEAQFNVSQGWNLADLGGARRAAARDERRAMSAAARAEALAARLEAARRWIELWALQRSEHLAERDVDEAQRTVSLAERALAGGAGSVAELAARRAELADAEQHRLSIEGERTHAALQLAIAMGRTPSPRLRTRGDLPRPALPTGAALDREVRRVAELPVVRVAELRAIAARTREVEASAEAAPILSVGFQLQRESPEAWMIYGNLGLQLPLFDQGQRATSQARAEAELAEGEHERAALEATAEMLDAVHEVEHARRLLASLRERAIPAFEAAGAARTRALELGEGTAFDVIDAHHQTRHARSLAIRAQGALSWAEVRLWLMLAQLAEDDEP